VNAAYIGIFSVGQHAAVAGRHQEAAGLPNHRGQGEEVLHVGVRPEQRVREAGGLQVRLDLCLAAPSADRGIGRCLAGDLDDVAHAVAGGAVDDRDLLGRDGRADEQDRVDAAHGRVQRVRPVEIARGDLDVAVRRSGGIPVQRPGGLVPCGE